MEEKNNKVFFATCNKDKIMKMKNRLKEINIDVVTPYDYNIFLKINEDGTDVTENAMKKAMAYYEKIRIPTIATDSSLYVEKFKKQPGLFVKRVNRS